MQTQLTNTKGEYIKQREQLHKIVLMLGYNELCPSIENAILSTFDKLKIDLIKMDGDCLTETLKCTPSKTITQLVKLSIQQNEFIFKLNFLIVSKSNIEIVLKHLVEHRFKIPSIVAYRLAQYIETM